MWVNETENIQGVVITQDLLSKDLTFVNDGLLTRLAASRPADRDWVIDLTQVSRAEAPITRFEFLAELDSNHLLCVLRIFKSRGRKKKIKCKKSLIYCTGDRLSNDNLQTPGVGGGADRG